MKCPCKNCEDRKVGCHGKCSDYKEWKSNHDKDRDTERRAKQYPPVFGNRSKY